jgi:protein-disulfide isomerase
MTTQSRMLHVLTLSICLFVAFSSTNGQAVPSKSAPAVKPIKNPPQDPHAVVEKEILNELRQIRLLLERQQKQQPAQQTAAPTPQPEKAKVSTAGFELGRKDAPITIVEFTDYQCPFCKQFHTTVFARLKKDYIDTGRVRFVSRDLPLEFHPNAIAAAQAARCAGEQDKYWEMRDALIAHADNLAPEAVAGYATGVGLDLPRFHACVDKGTYVASIRADLSEANAAGISGTPSFVVGPSSGATLTGETLVGAQPFETFEKILNQFSIAQK